LQDYPGGSFQILPVAGKIQLIAVKPDTIFQVFVRCNPIFAINHPE
jgi:hypothetical protein